LLTLGNRIIERHAIFSLAVVLVYLLLNLPEVIMVSQLGFTVWFPATGLILAVMLGISPLYFPLTVFASALAGAVTYHQPVLSWSGIVAPLLGYGGYAIAASLLRGPFKIDLALRQRRDVVRYVSITLAAAVFATVAGVVSLAADHTITHSQYWHSALSWYVGDVVGLVGFVPFLLIHILPRVRSMLSPLAPKDRRERRAATNKNSTDPSKRCTGGDRTSNQHRFSALDHVCANSRIQAALLFGDRPDYLDSHASRDSACREWPCDV
jgi:integral membrane sensor domain MASE1